MSQNLWMNLKVVKKVMEKPIEDRTEYKSKYSSTVKVSRELRDIRNRFCVVFVAVVGAIMAALVFIISNQS